MSASLDDVKNHTFDYIIIGGGAAGLTLAARLTEDEDKTVCVLEAGDANLNDPVILRPVGYGVHFGNKLYDWGHETTKQKLLEGRSCPWARGRTLGGSSAINFMVYSKPPAEEVDDFERLGNEGWNWKNLQRYIQKSEGLVDPSPEVQELMNLPPVQDVGRNGPLTVTYPRKGTKVDLMVKDALYNIGFTPAKRPFGGDNHGVYSTLNTHDPKTHTRSYSVTAYYLPNKDRKNLTVLVNANVHRVITEPALDGSDQLVAKAVEFEYGGEVHSVSAEKEVILSAGALRSPQILELSGIGRQDVLKKAGIALKLELPGVGENLQEHIIVSSTFELKDDCDYDTFDVLRDPERLAKEVELYNNKQSGVFSMGLTTIAFVPVDKVTPRAPSIYAHAKKVIDDLNAAGALPPGLREQYDIQLHRLKPGSGSGPSCEFLCFPGFNGEPNGPQEGKHYVSLAAAMNNLFSRGSIHIVSNDPNKEPEIDPHYMEHDIDLQVFTEQFKLIRNLAGTAPLKDIIAREHNPGSHVRTDEQIQDWLKKTFFTTWHTASTCSMLPKDKGGVVDNQLKVYGTSNLRVIDLSVVPLHFAAHTQAVVYGLAELAADMIRGRFES